MTGDGRLGAHGDDQREHNEHGRTRFPGQLAAPGSNEEAGRPDGDRDGRAPGETGLRILALDAGNTSGTALYDGGSVVLGRVVGREPAYDLLARVPGLDALAYEQFVIRQPIKEDHASVVYINGAIEAEARRRNIPFYRYTPRQSKSRISDELLQSLGWWPGFGLRTGGHAADAARILLCTLTDHYPQEMMKP